MIRRATIKDIHLLAPLFDQYRQFYKQSSDLTAAQDFLSERISNNESVIFFASENEIAVGFTQLYPTFSSVSMKKSWILNDLFVLDSIRGKGFGELLIKEASFFALGTGAKSLSLCTAFDNPAQKLYERLGWKVSNFKHYSLSL